MKKLIYLGTFLALALASGYIQRDSVVLSESIRRPLFITLHVSAAFFGVMAVNKLKLFSKWGLYEARVVYREIKKKDK